MVGFFAKLVLGPLAIGIGLLIALVSIPTSLGAGTWSEEFTSGAARFLYALPVNRHTMWWIKIASGVGSSIGLAAITLAIVLLTPTIVPAEAQASLFDQMQSAYGLHPLVVLLSFGSAALLGSYTIGLLVGVTVQSMKALRIILVVVNIVMVIGVSIVGTTLFLIGIAPGPTGVAITGAAVSTTLLLGSYIVFLQRNPYDDRPLRWWPWSIGSLAASFVVLLFVGVTAGIVAPGPWATGLIKAEVVRLTPSPDGEYVAGWTVRRIGESGLRLFDGKGERLHEIPGAMQVGVVQGTDEWQKGLGQHLFFCRLPSTTTGRISSTVAAIDPQTGETLTFPWTADDSLLHQVLSWDPSAERLETIQLKYTRDENTLVRTIGSPGQPTAEMVRELDRFDRDGSISIYSAGDGLLVVQRERHGYEREPTEYRVYDQQGDLIETATAAEDVESAWAVPGRPAVLTLQRHVSDGRVERSLNYWDLLTGESRTMLDRDAFESFSVNDALARRLPPVWVNTLPQVDSRWAVVRTPAKNLSQSILIEIDGERRFTFADDDLSLDGEPIEDVSIWTSLSADDQRLLRVSNNRSDDSNTWMFRAVVYPLDGQSALFDGQYASVWLTSPMWLSDRVLLFMEQTDSYSPIRLMQIDLTASDPTAQPWGPPETSGVDGPAGPAR
ncbi:MAG: ABC transporter permease [Planctomycetota bacterium]